MFTVNLVANILLDLVVLRNCLVTHLCELIYIVAQCKDLHKEDLT